MGPVTMVSERSRSFGAHHLGNAGYGHALSIQSAFNGPWEIEVQAGKSNIVTDDGAMRGWKTEVQSGSVMVNWVWQAAGNRNDAYSRNTPISKGFQPFIGIGIAHVDHIMKQDLEDAFGRTYHLWSDGTLRDRDEAGDHDGNALILRRDYTYESDVQDGALGSPAGRSLAIPAQIGVRLDVSPRIRTRFGISGWLGLNDAIDGQSGGQILSGDALASGFFGLGIRLGKLGPKQATTPTIPGVSMEDAALLASMDTDGDGINNLIDRCPGTSGMAVDENGCPLDSDGDGYADYRDAEIHSPHIDVDANGVSKDLTETADRSDWDVVRGTVTSDDRTSFSVRVRQPEEGWTEAEQKTLLAFNKLKESKGAVEVLTGPNASDAEAAAAQIRSAGMGADVVAPEQPETETITPNETASLASSGHYRVQLGAYQTPDEGALDVLFEGMEVVRLEGADGWTRIVSKSFDTKDAALGYAHQVQSLGFGGAFVTGHGTDATQQAEQETAPTAQPLNPSGSNGAAEQPEDAPPLFDASKVTFKIQVGALQSHMDVAALDQLLSMGSVEHRSSTGWHRYLHGVFADAQSAREALPEIQAAGFPDAFVVGDVAGSIVPVAEAEILLRKD